MAMWPRRPLWSALKTYTKQQAPDATYPDTGNIELTDLLLVNNAKATAGWVGWKNAATVQIDVDLGQKRPISFGQAWMLRRDADGIIQADTVEMFGSNDGANWTSLGSVAPALADLTSAWIEVTCTTLDEWRYARFEIKITVSGGDKFTFVGEVQVFGALFNYNAAQTGVLDAGANLAFLYRMNGPNTDSNEADMSGNGRTLTLTGTPPVETGILGASRQSNYVGGVRRYFRNDATGNIAWAKAASWMCWFRRRVDAATTSYRLILFLTTGTTNGSMPLGFYKGGNDPVDEQWWAGFNAVPPNYGGAVKSPIEEKGIPLNVWYHLACTYDGTTVRLYVNGNLAAVAAYATDVVTTTKIRIGGDAAASSSYLPDGDVDEPAAWTRVLSEAEIRWHVARRNGMVA